MAGFSLGCSNACTSRLVFVSSCNDRALHPSRQAPQSAGQMQGIDENDPLFAVQLGRFDARHNRYQRVGGTCPASLDEAAVQRMAGVVLNRYSGEHLDPDFTASIRTLSIVHQWCQSGTAKGAVKWVPWQLRMSQRAYQEIMEAHAARTLKTQAQLISTALFDDTPHQSIDKGHLNPAWLLRPRRFVATSLQCVEEHTLECSELSKKKFRPCNAKHAARLRAPHHHYDGTASS